MQTGVPAEWQRAFAWIEAKLGGTIVRAERQPRWRPAWFLDLERGGERVPLYFRGERGEADHGVYSLEHEMRVLQVLEAHEIPVPHVYGFCPEPRGIVMECSPGRANLATAKSESERESVLDHYIELLARAHTIDVGAFEAIGLERPRTLDQIGLVDHERWERAYRRDKSRPEPAIEFLIRWVRGHVPANRERVSFICGDAGQFLFDAGRVTALIDLELACLGDPAADLAGMRGRDLSEPLGDLSRAVRRYEALAGQPIDRSVIDYHTVRFNLVTPMATARLVADPPPGFDWVQYQSWYSVWGRSCFDVIGDALGLDLVAPGLPHGIDAALDSADSAGSFDAYEQDTEERIAEYGERVARFGPELADADLEEMCELLGKSYPSREEADRELERQIAAGDHDDDADCVVLFHRRLQREEALLHPLLKELRGVRIQKIG